MSETATLGQQEAPMYTVDRIPARQYTAECATVRVTLPSGSVVPVRVFGPDAGSLPSGASSSPAQVNWSAIGSVSPSDALAYAGAIALAACIASTLAPATGKVVPSSDADRGIGVHRAIAAQALASGDA